MKKTNRFIMVEKSNTSLFGVHTRIIVDTETGVNYLFCVEGYCGGLTPLLDADGKPVVWTRDEIEREKMRQ